jgi:hypothetical protein
MFITKKKFKYLMSIQSKINSVVHDMLHDIEDEINFIHKEIDEVKGKKRGQTSNR